MISEFDIRNAVGPLRRIFWGGIIVLLDININGFDLSNDVIGAILIAIGVTWLGSVDVGNRYRSGMRFVKIMAYISILTSILALFNESSLAPILTVVAVPGQIAVVVFCVCMRWFCIEGGLPKSAESWRLTTIFFSVLMGFYLIGIMVGLTGSRVSIQGPVALLVLLAMFVPIVHLFISTSRMKKEVASGGTYTGHGFEVLPPPDQQ
jgi:hypothetical protein